MPSSPQFHLTRPFLSDRLLAGYAASGAQVLAQLERVDRLRGARFEGPLVREALGAGTGQSRTWDRFAVLAHLEPAP